jgi:hypothetical protein
MFETRAPAVLLAPILTLPRGCFDIKNSKAARLDLSTTLKGIKTLDMKPNAD